ncbi:MAG: CoA transferase [Pseudomonadota bacterium]
MTSSRPLTGVRVLDFGQYLAGPLTGMMLADMGAEVIRIDPPGGPKWRDPAFDMLSRGKRTLRVDLKTHEGRETVIELAKRADAVIENFRPGVMGRLGVGADALRSANPNLIYLSMPGFASTDPELSGIAAWEAIVAARTGQFTDMGLNRRLMGIKASFSPLGLASAYAATFGAMSVLFALHSRDRTGGDHVEVPLASALFEGLVYNHERIEGYPDRYKSPRELELDRRAAAGEPCDLVFKELSEFLDPFYRTYTCKDGRGFYVVSGSIAAHPARVLKTLGLDELLADLPSFDPYLDTADWPDEWTLSNYPVGARDRARIAQAMKAAFLTKTAPEWDELFGAAKAPATAQRTTEEWLHDPHALSSGLILSVKDPIRGTMRQMGNVAWVAGDEAATEKVVPLPLFEKDLAALRSEAPRDQAQGAERGGWLDGFQVLDLTNVIAGPTIGSTLARFGAQVTHVQPARPSVDPWNAVVFGLQANRGKESILLDLKSRDGKEALNRLIRKADIVTLNATDEQRDALDFSTEALKAQNPAAILVQLDAFGGPMRGPKSDHLGYDDLAQAATGVMVRFGGGMEMPEEHAHAGTIDVLAGLTACVALGGALIQKDRTGEAAIARSSLAAAGGMIQAQFMYDFEGRSPFDEPSGRNALGWSAFYRCYEASDGWFFLAAPTDRQHYLTSVPELADLASSPEPTLARELAARFATRPVQYWIDALNTGATAAVSLASMLETRDEALQVESDGPPDITRETYRAVRHDTHPMGRWCDLAAPNAIRPRSAVITIPGHAQKYGAQTTSILKRIGFEPEEVDEMLSSGAASESWSRRFLPS